MKLSTLVNHFMEHRAENPHLSFLGYISLHYFNGNLKDKDYERDQQLPFKTSDLAAAITLNIPSQVFIVLHHPTLQQEKKIPFYSAHIPTQSNTDIWQPPRMIC
ncbi:MAG: hypothetical protein ACOYKE_06675 [Ferruginibacter sp.]